MGFNEVEAKKKETLLIFVTGFENEWIERRFSVCDDEEDTEMK